MNDVELEATGVSPDLVRLSIGLEDLEDLLLTWPRLSTGYKRYGY